MPHGGLIQMHCLLMLSLPTRIIFFFYAFPPFSLIGKCLEKIQANQAESILVMPCWTCQSWYPKLLRLLVAPPLMIIHRETLLTLPGCQKLHPLRKKLNLLACHVCGDYKNRCFSEIATNINCSPILAPIITETV